jgi:acyl-[acyl-carrier-protein]-phospholipid O-acyltransferase / long-chain-fatty-acid--[acyl-carrier-protein] ligase
MRWFFRTDHRSFYCLNATQFLSALNDNVFKLLVIYLLISIQGPAAANTILSLAGAIFVIPFLLFSSTAGVLADRFSKRTIIVVTRMTEILILLFGATAVFFEWGIGAYTALFLMAMQAAILGPSKYGIIPELVDQKMVSKANGSMTSFTYLAIILGTFLASFITDITDKNFVLVAAFCVFIGLVGLLSSLGIRRTEPQNSPKKITPFFLYEIYQTLKFGWTIPHLLPAMYGSSFFLFIGAFTQLNIIPFAMQSLHLTDVGGGYLFLATAVGIAVGAVVAGQLSKDRVEPGLSCISGFFIVFFFFMLYFFSWSLIITIISLACIGIAGGAYLIPFDSFLQVNSPDIKRGQVIAAANFFSFVGVLMASLCLYFISEELGFSAASGFAFMGILTFISNIIITGRLSALFLPFFVQKILKRFRRLQLVSPVPDPTHVVILQSNSWWDAILLFSCMPKLKVLIPAHYFRRFPWINGFVDSIRIVPPEPDPRATLVSLFGQAKRLQNQNCSACLFIQKRDNSQDIIEAYKKVFGRLHYHIVFAHGKKERIRKKFLFFHYWQKQITLSFSKE